MAFRADSLSWRRPARAVIGRVRCWTPIRGFVVTMNSSTSRVPITPYPCDSWPARSFEERCAAPSEFLTWVWGQDQDMDVLGFKVTREQPSFVFDLALEDPSMAKILLRRRNRGYRAASIKSGTNDPRRVITNFATLVEQLEPSLRAELLDRGM